MTDLIIGEPDVIRKEDNILWLRAEIERLTVQLEDVTGNKSQADETIMMLQAKLKQANAVVEAAKAAYEAYEDDELTHDHYQDIGNALAALETE